MSKKVFIKTFGCQMNEYDSNRIFDSIKKIGFIKTEEIEDESWISELIQHILSCLAIDCERCRTAAENNFLGFLKTR